MTHRNIPRILIVLVGLSVFATLVLQCCDNRKEQQELRHTAQVDSLMQQLSIREKVAQLFILEISREPSDSTRALQDSLIRDYGVGALIIMRGPIHPFVDRMNELQAMADLPLLVATDAEWGAAMRFAEYLPYPRQRILGRMEGRRAEKLLYQMGRNVGQELRDLNIYVNYAPVVDVCPDSYDKSDGQRSFDSDPERVGRFAAAYMHGMQDEGVYSCAKHYPGHGATRVDSHYAMPVVLYDRAQFDSVGLVPFQRLIDEGVAMIMVAHMSIPAIDSTGVPMSISAPCMKDLLRGEQGFDGVVITDAVGMQGVAAGRTPLEVNTAVYRAGSDMILMPEDIKCSIDAIADSVETGVWPLEELDAKVRKVLELKARAGFFDQGFDPQVRDLDRKIAEARHRDSTLLIRIGRALERSSRPYIEPVFGDRTLVLDKAGK
jgi:beta-glucosidase-like glycosyl hydrolase